jgi:hypothetical protein
MMSKYFAGKMVEEWVHAPHKPVANCFIVWKALVDSFPLIGNWLVWKIGNEKRIRIGEDPWEGSEGNFNLSSNSSHL